MTDLQTAPPTDLIHVFRIALSLSEAGRLTESPDALAASLGGITVDTSKAEVIDPRQLAAIGLSGYLVEGLGASKGPVAADAARLDDITDPVLILRPGAAAAPRPSLAPGAPLSHLGSYPLEAARPVGAPLRTPSAEGLVTGAPPVPPEPVARRRMSGIVALVALGVMFLLVALMLLVAG